MTLRGLGSLTGWLAPRGNLAENTNGVPSAVQWWWLLVLLAPVYLVLAAVLPPADDEVYYWCWSKTLQFSYYDHPAMSAYLIRISTALLGDSVFAMRLPAVVATLTVFAVIGYLTRPRTLLPLIAVTPLFTFGSVLVTPDTPLILFWALYVTWMVKVHERLDSNARVPMWLWTLGGVILGCGVLGKYTMALGAMAGFAAFVFAGNLRRWWLGYLLHGVVAFLVATPILIHNVRQDFVPLLYQWKHSMSSSEPGLRAFGEFTGVQLLLFGTAPFWVFGWAIRKRKLLLADARLRVCFSMFVLPFAFFLFKATRGRLEGNWALACYIAVWPLVATWFETKRASLTWRRLTVSSFLPPLICVLLLGAHLLHPLPILPAANDRITRQYAKVDLAQQAAKSFAEMNLTDVPLFATDYQWTALLRYAGADAKQFAGLTRPSHFTMNAYEPPLTPQQYSRSVVFAEGFIREPYIQGLNQPKILASFPLVVRGKQVSTFWLIEYTKAN